MYTAVLFDIDGTLVDSNDAHASAWVQAFAEAGIPIEFDQVRRLIGMGGDKLMPIVSGIAEQSPDGSRISARRGELFKSDFAPGLQPFRDARQLVAEVKARGFAAVAASSAKADELDLLLDIAGVTRLFDAATSSDDAGESKPDPDIVGAALKRVQTAASDAVMIGDTPYDLEAARRAGVAMIGFRCGGWDDEALRGAIATYDGPWDLLAKMDESPLRAGPRHRSARGA